MTAPTPLQKFAAGMSTLLKLAEDYPEELKKRVEWDQFIAALQEICEAVGD